MYCVGNTLRTLCYCVHRQSHQHKHTCWMDIGTAPSVHTSRLPCSEEETATILYELIEKNSSVINLVAGSLVPRPSHPSIHHFVALILQQATSNAWVQGWFPGLHYLQLHKEQQMSFNSWRVWGHTKLNCSHIKI